jgi:hypothetical protein
VSQPRIDAAGYDGDGSELVLWGGEVRLVFGWGP